MLLVGGLAVALASPSPAADFTMPDAASIYANDDWSGFYAGVFGGYAVGRAVTQSSVSDEIGVSGGLLGVAAGVNHQLDNLVLGVEADIAWSNAEGSVTCAANALYECTGNLNWLSTFRARAGVAFDHALLYATAGLAIAGATATVTPAPPTATGEYSDTFLGWTVGVGGELKLTEAISVRAEYAYVDLGSRTAPQGTLTNIGGDTEISPTLHAVKAGLNFAF
jgi:outer membrane immunogenic protein